MAVFAEEKKEEKMPQTKGFLQFIAKRNEQARLKGRRKIFFSKGNLIIMSPKNSDGDPSSTSRKLL